MDMNSHELQLHYSTLELKIVSFFSLILILCIFFYSWSVFKICRIFEDRQDDEESQNEEEIEMNGLNRIHNYENALQENESTDPIDI